MPAMASGTAWKGPRRNSLKVDAERMGDTMKADYKNAIPVMEDSLPAVLMRIVGELNEVAELIERVEPQLAALHEEADHAAERVTVLQGIDLAVQKTRGLADFMTQMTLDMPGAWMIDLTTALNLVKLGDMRRALSDELLDQDHTQPILMASGDFEAF